MQNFTRLSCNSCGATLTAKDDRAFCEYCGAKYAPLLPTQVQVELGQGMAAMAAHYERLDSVHRASEEKARQLAAFVQERELFRSIYTERIWRCGLSDEVLLSEIAQQFNAVAIYDEQGRRHPPIAHDVFLLLVVRVTRGIVVPAAFILMAFLLGGVATYMSTSTIVGLGFTVGMLLLGIAMKMDSRKRRKAKARDDKMAWVRALHRYQRGELSGEEIRAMKEEGQRLYQEAQSGGTAKRQESAMAKAMAR